MSHPSSNLNYDCIFIGTSIICVLEAIYQARCGKSVLMVDRQADIGGAWATLELFGLQDVENAVHYFLDDPVAFDFMRKKLGWTVIESPQKYRIFPRPILGIQKLPFNSFWERCLTLYFEKVGNPIHKSDGLQALWLFLQAVQEAYREPKRTSYYVAGGNPEMIRKIRELLLTAEVEIKFQQPIERVDINPTNDSVTIQTSDAIYSGRTLYVTHASRITNLYRSGHLVPVQEVFHWRPQIHLLLHDPSPSRVLEGIFLQDVLIKYVHDVTRFTKQAEVLKHQKKVLAVALQSDCQESDAIYDQVLARLKATGIIGSQAILEDRCWWNIHLPVLDDTQLETLERLFAPQITTLKTENFAVGIGLHAERWSQKL